MNLRQGDKDGDAAPLFSLVALHTNDSRESTKEEKQVCRRSLGRMSLKLTVCFNRHFLKSDVAIGILNYMGCEVKNKKKLLCFLMASSLLMLADGTKRFLNAHEMFYRPGKVFAAQRKGDACSPAGSRA